MAGKAEKRAVNKKVKKMLQSGQGLPIGKPTADVFRYALRVVCNRAASAVSKDFNASEALRIAFVTISQHQGIDMKELLNPQVASKEPAEKATDPEKGPVENKS